MQGFRTMLGLAVWVRPDSRHLLSWEMRAFKELLSKPMPYL
jgi:hypothetical protein